MSEKIYKLRKGLSLSQEEFGAMLSVSRQAVSKWELGQSTPDIEVLRKIKQLFGISYDELIDNDLPGECKSELIADLRRKRHFFYYSIVLIVTALVSFMFYIYIRLNGTYDAFIFNSELKAIQNQGTHDWFYCFINSGLLMFSGLSLSFGLVLIYFAQKKDKQ